MKSGGASEDEMLLSSNRNRSEEEEVNKLIKKAHVPMSPERQAMEEHFEKRFETIFQD